MELVSDENRLVSKVPATLAALLGVSEEQVEAHPLTTSQADLVLDAAGHTFVVEVKARSSAGPIAAGAEHAVRAAKSTSRRAIPVVAVPYMSTSGKQACERAGASWFDFSGNAHIIAPGIRIIVDGRPNQYRKRGRPSSVFAPKSSRIARFLLMHPGEAVAQRELANATDVSEGLVSRVISRLAEDRYVTRDERGHVRVSNPQLLLEAWRDEYRFSKHRIVRGHVAARSGDALTRAVAETLSTMKIEHAATGLSAAWQLTRFVGFRIATLFLRTVPDEAIKNRLGLHEDARGANLWLVVPNDAGVFQGADDRDGVRCVHPVQVYLDLKEHPERAADAAERVRTECLSW